MTVKEIVDRISYFRTQKGYSARKLSIMIGKSETYIHSLEQGSFELSISMLLEILETLEVSPAEFFSDNPANYKNQTELLDFFGKLSSTQQEAIMNLYKK